MRIAIVNSHYYPDELGGAERSLRFLAEAAVARGHVCTVFTTGEARESTELNGVGIERFALRKRPSSTAAARAKLLWHLRDTYSSAGAVEMANAIRRFAPNVAHTNNLSGISVALWGCLRRLGIPVAHTLRDYYLLCPNTAQFRNGQSCGSRCGACRVMGAPRIAATRHVNTVIGNSRFVLESHLRAGAFERSKQDVIYNGYEAPASVAPRVALPVERPLTIGFIGRLAPTKGLELLIDAFSRVAMASERPMSLRIAGTGDVAYVDGLRARARKASLELAHQTSAEVLGKASISLAGETCAERLGKASVEFAGKLSPASFYDSVDLTIVPSLWHEPLARVIFESFAHGVPVLASNRGGSPELVVAGETGWLFDPAVEGSLEQILRAAIQELKAGAGSLLSTRCLREAKRFLPDRVVDSHLQVFERLVS